jgi:hypothetical protein
MRQVRDENRDGNVRRGPVVKETGGWRRSLARWIDPTLDGPPESAPVTPVAAPPVEPDPWPAISEQFALRILAAAYQMSSQLEAAEADERDPDRLAKLYRIDHATARVRRQAENLHVLGGRRIEDADRQVTALLDVVRASVSSIEHYSRVQLGRIVDLAVVEYAADDAIRVLTELIDNATRFSPPDTRALVSAHLTERGSVLLRVEDCGIGIHPERLPEINMMLAGTGPVPVRQRHAMQFGLAVVQRLAVTHGMRVHLVGRQPTGTTATVLIPQALLCEIPGPADETGAAPQAALPQGRPAAGTYRSGSVPPPHDGTAARNGHHGWAPGNGPDQRRPDAAPARPPGPGSHRVDPTGNHRVEPHTAAGPRTGNHRPEPGGGHRGGLPVRIPGSIRDQAAPPAPPPAPPPDRDRWADETADFAAGIGDARRDPADPTGQVPS